MANILVTSGTNYISFDLGVYGTPLNMYEVLRSKTSVSRVVRRSAWVEYWVSDRQEPYLLHFEENSNNAMIVDSINGNEVISLQDLYDKIKSILNT